MWASGRAGGWHMGTGDFHRVPIAGRFGAVLGASGAPGRNPPRGSSLTVGTRDPSSVCSRGNSRAKDTGGGWSQPASVSPLRARIKGAAGAGGTRRHIMETEFLLKKEKALLCQNAQHSAHTLAWLREEGGALPCLCPANNFVSVLVWLYPPPSAGAAPRQRPGTGRCLEPPHASAVARLAPTDLCPPTSGDTSRSEGAPGTLWKGGAAGNGLPRNPPCPRRAGP